MLSSVKKSAGSIIALGITAYDTAKEMKEDRKTGDGLQKAAKQTITVAEQTEEFVADNAIMDVGLALAPETYGLSIVAALGATVVHNMAVSHFAAELKELKPAQGSPRLRTGSKTLLVYDKSMSFINTIEDDSDPVELIVRQRLEAKPGCNIVGFDQFDQAGAVTELSTQLSSNSSRIDGIIASLSDTDANVIALNSNLLTAIANTASNTVTNASLVSGLRADVDSNSALTSNLQANTVAIAADLASNSALVSGLRTDLDANATLLGNTITRVTVVEQNTSNLSNLTNTVSEHTTDILNLEQSVNLLDSIEGALDGNSRSAIAALTGRRFPGDSRFITPWTRRQAKLEWQTSKACWKTSLETIWRIDVWQYKLRRQRGHQRVERRGQSGKLGQSVGRRCRPF